MVVAAFKQVVDVSGIDIDTDTAQTNVGWGIKTVAAAINLVKTTAFDKGHHTIRIRCIAAAIHIFNGIVAAVNIHMGPCLGIIAYIRIIVRLIAAAKHGEDCIAVAIDGIDALNMVCLVHIHFHFITWRTVLVVAAEDVAIDEVGHASKGGHVIINVIRCLTNANLHHPVH